MNSHETSSNELLIIYERGKEKNYPSHDEMFVITDEIQNISQQEYDNIYAELSNADVDLGAPVPLYRIAWPHILKEQRGQLLELTVLYRQLQNRISQSNPTVLICGEDVSNGYCSVIQDFGSAHSITVDGVDQPVSWVGAARRFVVPTVLLLPFLFDQLVSLLLKRVTNMSTDTTVTYVPALGRLSSLKPVFEKSSFEFDIVVSSFLSSWLWRYRDSELDGFGTQPISKYTSVSCICRQFKLHLWIGRNVLFADRLETELGQVLEAKLDVKLDTAITYSIQNGFRTRMFGSLFLYPLFDSYLSHVNPEKVVLGKLSPGGRAVLYSGIQNNVDMYHVPHGIGTSRCPNPPATLTQCVSGELQSRHYRQSPQVKTLWDTVITGRPYLTELYEEYGDTSQQPRTDSYRIVIATQPFGQRDSFVQQVISAVDQSPLDATVIIKTHPSEDPSFYSEYVNKYPYVSVTSEDLFKQLQRADLTFTVYSNVGVESIIVGTPTVCVNDWDPIIPIPIYARYGPIPVLSGEESIRAFFNRLDTQYLSALQAHEREFIHDSYELKTDAAENIYNVIK